MCLSYQTQRTGTESIPSCVSQRPSPSCLAQTKGSVETQNTTVNKGSLSTSQTPSGPRHQHHRLTSHGSDLFAYDGGGGGGLEGGGETTL